MRIQIAFSEKSVASVGFLDPVANLAYTGKSEAFIQVWISTCYILRQFRNLRGHPSAEGLISHLGTWNHWIPKDEKLPEQNIPVIASLRSPMETAAIYLGLDYETAASKYGYSLWLEEKKPLTKGFEGILELREKGPAFILHPTGFGIRGLLGIGISEYSVNSVPMILTYLALLHQDEPENIKMLQAVSRACAKVATQKEITMANQEMLGFDITESAGYS